MGDAEEVDWGHILNDPLFWDEKDLKTNLIALLQARLWFHLLNLSPSGYRKSFVIWFQLPTCLPTLTLQTLRIHTDCCLPCPVPLA